MDLSAGPVKTSILFYSKTANIVLRSFMCIQLSPMVTAVDTGSWEYSTVLYKGANQKELL